MRRLLVRGIAALAALVVLMPAGGLAYANETGPGATNVQKFEVTLTPTSTDGGLQVTLDVAGMSLDITFQITPQGQINILSVEGAPADATVKFAGDDVKVKLADGTKVKADLDPVYSPEGNLTAVEAEGKVCDPEGDARRCRHHRRWRHWRHKRGNVEGNRFKGNWGGDREGKRGNDNDD